VLEDQNDEGSGEKIKRSVRRLSLLVLIMFGFGFAMVPLYDLLCSVAGINGIATARSLNETELSGIVDKNREITIEFDATNNAELPWDFYPVTKRVTVHPGEFKSVTYFAKNNSDKTIVAQAIPGITPWQATEYFNKAECFCFAKQTLGPGETKEMPLRFVVNASLPKDFNTITLSYTFMDTDRSKLRDTSSLPSVL
jgi:cytochrome c oxidase assembly protein subunit 11